MSDHHGAPPPRPQAPRPPQQEYMPQYQQPMFSQMNSNDVASKVVDAYKTSPLLTGLLLLNLLIFIGAGWYLNVVQDRTAAYVKSRDQDLKELQNKALDMAKNCIVPDGAMQRSYQQPQYAPPPPPQYYPPEPPAPRPAPQPPVATVPPPPATRPH